MIIFHLFGIVVVGGGGGEVELITMIGVLRHFMTEPPIMLYV